MSKDQLEELKFLNISEAIKCIDPNYSGEYKSVDVDEVVKVVQWLIEQAERVQELERVNKQLKSNLSVYKGYYKNMIKINEDIVEENNRYREKFEAIQDIQQWHRKEPDYEVLNIVNEALEESE